VTEVPFWPVVLTATINVNGGIAIGVRLFWREPARKGRMPGGGNYVVVAAR